MSIRLKDGPQSKPRKLLLTLISPRSPVEYLFIIIMIYGFLLLAFVGLSQPAVVENRQATSVSSSRATATVPEYFQTTPGVYAGNHTLTSALRPTKLL